MVRGERRGTERNREDTGEGRGRGGTRLIRREGKDRREVRKEGKEDKQR